MAYAVSLKRSAAKDLEAIEQPHRSRIREAIAELASDPRPVGSRKLQGELGHRIRIGDYRVKYTVDDAAEAVLVREVKHRREAYR